MKSRKNRAIAWLALGVLALSAPAYAAKPKKKKKEPNIVSDVISTEIAHATLASQFSQDALNEEETPRELAIEGMVSSWTPSSLRLSNQLGSDAEFKSQGAPNLSVNLVSPFKRDSRWGTLSWRAGLGYQHLERSDTIRLDAMARPASQSAHLVPIRAGAEWEPELGRKGIFAPFVQASLLPTLVITPRSAFGPTTTSFGVPAEFGLGYSASVRPYGYAIRLEAGAVATLGTIRGSNVSALGAQAGARLGL